MDETREAREELAQLARDDADDARQAAEEAAYWQDVGLSESERVAAETWRWSR